MLDGLMVCLVQCGRVDISSITLDSDTDPERAAELAKVAAYPQGPTRKLKADENDIFNGRSLHHRPAVLYSYLPNIQRLKDSQEPMKFAMNVRYLFTIMSNTN
jgi:hypothetical protein